MSDENEDLDDPAPKGDNSRVHRRIGRLSSENKQLTASLADANAKMADLQKMVEKAGTLGKDFEKLTAERDGARRMVVLRSGGIKSSKEARELLALTNEAIEEGWLKAP